MRIVFLGTPTFAVPSLEALVKAGHSVAAVYTQPDRPKGRGNQVTESPVKIAARRLQIPVVQPERIRRPEFRGPLKQARADLMVVVGYGQIIPQSIIDIPPHGILNVHGSLLPKYRGAAPIQWAIANGEERTGVTIMRIDAGLDTGEMLLKAELEIGADETAPELGERLAALGAASLVGAIDDIVTGRSQPEKQNNDQATYAPILTKDDGRVRWEWPARQIHNRQRGFTPWPGASTTFRGMTLSLLRVKPMKDSTGLPALMSGEIVAEKRRLLAGCGEGSLLEILELQPSGKRGMTAEAFVNGYKPGAGERFAPPDAEPAAHMETETKQ